MLLAAIVPKVATAVSLLFSVRAAPQGCAAGSKGAAINWHNIKESILYSCAHISGLSDTLYDKLFKDCMDGHDDSKFHSGIEVNTEFKADANTYTKRRFVTFYLLSCKEPEAEFSRLVAADPTQKRYEVLFDLVDRAGDADEWNKKDTFYREAFKVTPADVRKSREIGLRLRPLLFKQLYRKIEETVSVGTVEYLKGVLTADTVAEAFMHMLRRGICLGCDISFDDLSDLVACALKSENREETIRQFIKPLVVIVMGMGQSIQGFVLCCARAVREGMKGIDAEEAKKLEAELFDWEEISCRILMNSGGYYFEFAVAMGFDPRDVTKCVNKVYSNDSFYRLRDAAKLTAISAYYLDVLDADGQTRLQMIADDDNLMSGLPHEVTSRLLADCTKLSAEYPAEAEYLKARLSGEPEPKRQKLNK
ncbi:hypothetical protein PAPHI01_1416 [Pancytospora philotis]|nr:hypothetical protein PAPHI01_1416 [Pancytospora philotis]